MSKRSMEFKMPKHSKISDPVLSESTGNVMTTVAKWVPLICAGAAIGVSIIALKEIQNVKKELILAKRQHGPDEELAKRLEIMEFQLKKLSDFIMVPKNINKHVTPKKHPKNILDEVIKNAMNPPQTEVKIINENEKYDPTEYEEVEVTDDEED